MLGFETLGEVGLGEIKRQQQEELVVEERREVWWPVQESPLSKRRRKEQDEAYQRLVARLEEEAKELVVDAVDDGRLNELTKEPALHKLLLKAPILKEPTTVSQRDIAAELKDIQRAILQTLKDIEERQDEDDAEALLLAA